MSLENTTATQEDYATAEVNETLQNPLTETTFLIRLAPSRSEYAGKLCAEIHAASEIKIKSSLEELGLTDDMIVLEMAYVRSATTGLPWKLFRFIAPAKTYRTLHELCSPSDIEAIAQLTDKHLTALSRDMSIKQLKRLSKNALLQYADLISTIEVDADMTKGQIATKIFDAVVAA